ncbi:MULTISPECIES: hypothetical protein [unclassified Phaeobacter]|uniref:hypothetical protein n=1 Tax=unclassified Phaeobacter TaxID=2621772 RepID=UPI003A8889AD
MGDWVSWGAGVALLFYGTLVMWAYRPTRWTDPDAPGWLQAAIFCGFLAAVGNTAFWQVFGQPAVKLGWLTVAQLRGAGNWLDLLFKGGGALAAYLHLKAMHKSLSDEEQARWSVTEMAFYPNRRLCLRVLARITKRRK